MSSDLSKLLATIDRLKKELHYKNECLHKKNVALDALHWVWCDGGCGGGMHRYNKLPKITDEMIKTAECNLERMKRWKINNDYKYSG